MKQKKTRNTKTGSETSIQNGALYFEDCKQCDVDSAAFAEIIGDGYTKSIRLISLDRAWYETEYIGFTDAKISQFINMQMTLRREVRSGRGHWYAYRRVLGKLHKRYVGTDETIDQKTLLEVAKKMPTT